jgi:hypothetical protein
MYTSRLEIPADFALFRVVHAAVSIAHELLYARATTNPYPELSKQEAALEDIVALTSSPNSEPNDVVTLLSFRRSQGMQATAITLHRRKKMLEDMVSVGRCEQ